MIKVTLANSKRRDYLENQTLFFPFRTLPSRSPSTSILKSENSSVIKIGRHSLICRSARALSESANATAGPLDFKEKACNLALAGKKLPSPRKRDQSSFRRYALVAFFQK